MKIIEKRQFDYIQDKIFKNLSKRDKDNLRKYRNTYRWYKDNNNKLKALEDEINKRKKKEVQIYKRPYKKEQRIRSPKEILSIYLVNIQIKEKR